jgi:hypothetical protein
VKSVRKWLRGMVGTGIVWALGWGTAILGLVLVQVFGAVSPPTISTLLEVFLVGGSAGFIAGAVFSVGLTLVYRDTAFESLRSDRFALLGALIGAGLPSGLFALAGAAPPFGVAAGFLLFGAALGATTSVLSLKVAQSGEHLLESSSDTHRLAAVQDETALEAPESATRRP